MPLIWSTPSAFSQRLRDAGPVAAAPARVTVAAGDGIGPEITAAVLRVLSAAGAALEVERVDVGAPAYRRGFPSGIADDTWDSLRRTRVFLKGPITRPPEGGATSPDATLRTALGLPPGARACAARPRIDIAHCAAGDHRAIEVAREYPDCGAEQQIGGLETPRLADWTDRVDLLLTPDRSGEFGSPVVARRGELLRLTGAATVGPECAMFEAAHGLRRTLPDVIWRTHPDFCTLPSC